MKLITALLLALSPLHAYQHHPIIIEVNIEPQILIYRDVFGYGLPKDGDRIMVPMWVGEEHINYLYVVYDESYYDLICHVAYWYEVI